jgi:hypothetical protein
MQGYIANLAKWEAVVRASVKPANAQAAPMRDAVEHALTRFECLEDHFKEAGDEALWAMSSVDADRMRKAIDQDQAISPAQPQADRETDWRLRALRAEAEIDRLLTQPQAAGIPAGWKLVPERPTQVQMDAGLYQASADSSSADVYSIYADMIDMAPSIQDHPNDTKPVPSPAKPQGAREALAVLRAYEQWEADIILENKCWTGQNVQLTDDLYQRMIELQEARNAAIAALTRPLREMTDGDGK